MNRDNYQDEQARIDEIAGIVAAATGFGTADATRVAIAVVAENPESGSGLLPGYSAALDQLYDLRFACVHEARIIEAHLDLASYPKSQRDVAERAVRSLREATAKFNSGDKPVAEPVLTEEAADEARHRRERIAATLVTEGVAERLVDGIVRAIIATPTDQWSHYVAATREVEFLRELLAHQGWLLAHALSFKTFPKSRRAIAELQVERMRRARSPRSFAVDYAGLNRWHAQKMLRDAGAEPLLTRAGWEQNREVPRSSHPSE